MLLGTSCDCECDGGICGGAFTGALRTAGATSVPLETVSTTHCGSVFASAEPTPGRGAVACASPSDARTATTCGGNAFVGVGTAPTSLLQPPAFGFGSGGGGGLHGNCCASGGGGSGNETAVVILVPVPAIAVAAAIIPTADSPASLLSLIP